MTMNSSIVRITSFPTNIAGHACANALAANGIRATVVGDHTSDFQMGAAGNVDVVVPVEQASQAQSLLDEMKAGAHLSANAKRFANGTSLRGWKRILVWTILWINIIGVLSYIGILLIFG